MSPFAQTCVSPRAYTHTFTRTLATHNEGGHRDIMQFFIAYSLYPQVKKLYYTRVLYILTISFFFCAEWGRVRTGARGLSLIKNLRRFEFREDVRLDETFKGSLECFCCFILFLYCLENTKDIKWYVSVNGNVCHRGRRSDVQLLLNTQS